jgi:serine/threonine protein kinase
MHGDLKPDNLLLSADGRLTVSDFGSATVLVRMSASACWQCQLLTDNHTSRYCTT